MKFLVDTHLLLWAAAEPRRLPRTARALFADEASQLIFSAASIWEIAIKSGIGRADFQLDPAVLRRYLLENDYIELPVSSAHAALVHRLPYIHRDPFDRLLIAQAVSEGIPLITSDRILSQYSAPLRLV